MMENGGMRWGNIWKHGMMEVWGFKQQKREYETSQNTWSGLREADTGGPGSFCGCRASSFPKKSVAKLPNQSDEHDEH